MTKSLPPQEPRVPHYLPMNDIIAVYYGDEHIQVQQQTFDEEKMTELIYLLTDVCNSKTVIKIKSENGLTEVFTLKPTTIFACFEKLTSKQRMEVIGQLDYHEISEKLYALDITPRSQAILGMRSV